MSATATDPANNTSEFSQVLQPQPLAVTFRSFTASRSGKGVLLRWRTASEIDTLGFNLWRERKGRRIRLNRVLIPSLWHVSGASYSYRDRRAPRRRALRFWLQVVDADGSRSWHGPLSVAGRL